MANIPNTGKNRLKVNFLSSHFLGTLKGRIFDMQEFCIKYPEAMF